MNPKQREAAERLIKARNVLFTHKAVVEWADHAEVLLRELLAADAAENATTDAKNATVEPVQEPVTVSVKRREWKALSLEAQEKLTAISGDPCPEYLRQHELAADPVAWAVYADGEVLKTFESEALATEWRRAEYDHSPQYEYAVGPLYAAPQQRKPLTDEQLKQAMSDAGVRVFQPGLWDVLLDAGRAIERAHGITGEPT